MEDIDKTTDFTQFDDETLLHDHVIRAEADLFYLHCCLMEAFADNADV